MKAGVFKLNMHPKDYFDRNPFHEDGKGGRNRSEHRERSKSAPSDKKPFRFSSPGKTVRFSFVFNFSKKISIEFCFLLARWKQRWLLR